MGLLKSGKKKDEAMEQCSQSRFVAAKVHTVGYIFTMYKEAVEEMEEGPETEVLRTVCRLYGLWQVEELQGYFLKCEYGIWVLPVFRLHDAAASAYIPANGNFQWMSAFS